MESEFVSKNINNWIDLIFGYKQTGEAAEKANNVFLPTSYEGNNRIELISDPFERRALKVQISEYGQTPKQLFKVPHLMRKSRLSIARNLEFIDITPKKIYEQKKENIIKVSFEKDLERKLKANSHELLYITSDEKELFLFEKNNMLTIYDSQQINYKKSLKVSGSKVNSFVSIEKDISAFGCSDANICLLHHSYGFTKQSFEAHSDSITQLFYLPYNVW